MNISGVIKKLFGLVWFVFVQLPFYMDPKKTGKMEMGVLSGLFVLFLAGFSLLVTELLKILSWV